MLDVDVSLVGFAIFDGLAALFGVVVEGTDLRLVAALAVAVDALVLVGVVEALHSGVTLVAHYTLLALVPADALNQGFAIFREVPKDLRRAAEVARMVRIDATLGVVRILLVGTPSGLVLEHVEDEELAALPLVEFVQVDVQGRAVDQTFWDKIVLDA